MTVETQRRTEWEVRPIEDLPIRKLGSGRQPTGFADAVRGLGAGEALFVALREGETPRRLAHRVAPQIRAKCIRLPERFYHVREATDGLWVWWEPRA